MFGWGKNSFGQLGINDMHSKAFPTQLKTLRSIGVRYIACGDDFSVFLTQDGGVFTCGAGMFGQLGHGGSSNEILPRMVIELMGSTVNQISCGRRHTLVLVPSRGRVYGFGFGGSGQLGTRGCTNSSVPLVVMGPWVDSIGPNSVSMIEAQTTDQDCLNESVSMVISKIFAGGDHCFVSLVERSKSIPPDDFRFYK